MSGCGPVSPHDVAGRPWMPIAPLSEDEGRIKESSRAGALRVFPAEVEGRIDESSRVENAVVPHEAAPERSRSWYL